MNQLLKKKYLKITFRGNISQVLNIVIEAKVNARIEKYEYEMSFFFLS